MLVKLSRPDGRPVLYIEQLQRDPEAFAEPADPPVKDKINAQLDPRSKRIYVMLVVPRDRTCRANGKFSNTGKSRDYRIRETNGEVRFIGISGSGWTHQAERENGDKFCV